MLNLKSILTKITKPIDDLRLRARNHIYSEMDDIRFNIKLRQELNVINPNWQKENRINEINYLQLLKEIYQLGLKPGQLIEIYNKINQK